MNELFLPALVCGVSGGVVVGTLISQWDEMGVASRAVGIGLSSVACAMSILMLAAAPPS